MRDFNRLFMGRISPGAVVFSVALVVVGASTLTRLAESIGGVDPHVWVETAPAEEKVIGKRNRYMAVEGVMDGEVARTAERLREATALAMAASLYAATERISGRPKRTVGDLLRGLTDNSLLPPGMAAGQGEGTISSPYGTLFVRYRPSPLGIEVVALGKELRDGPALMVRVPDDGTSENGTLVFMARQLEGVVIPQPFASVAEVIARGWEPEKLHGS